MLTDGKIAAVIVAAGLSSRAKAFKPLLPLRSSTFIETAIDTFQRSGIGEIVVITGHQAEILEAHIAATGAICLRSDYLRNKMFDSACIGLNHLQGRCEMAFFTPVDSPLFTKYSLAAMIQRMRSADRAVICPRYREKRGHPLLIRSSSFAGILAHDGAEGMKGAVGRLQGVEMIDLPDPALIMDADTPEAYEAMKRYEWERAVPSEETCLDLHEALRTPEKIIRHCLKVAWLAETLATALAEQGCCLDRKRIRAAALLHDIARTEKNHAARGAALVEDLGFTGIAAIVGAHMELDDDDATRINEKSVVYLADKRVQGDSVVSLAERFGRKMERCRTDEEAYRAVRKKYEQALQVEKMIDQAITQH